MRAKEAAIFVHHTLTGAVPPREWSHPLTARTGAAAIRYTRAMTWRLEYRAETTLPVELDGLTPDALRGRAAGEIERLPIQFGNRSAPVAEFFRVSRGGGDDATLELVGDLSGVDGIGAKLARGTIRVLGSVGRHAGNGLRGGALEIAGDAGDWLGAEMRGGTIRVDGRAGDQVGAAYAGSPRGMQGGSIVVLGAAGLEVGRRMRRGLIAVGGAVGPLAGCDMLAGTLLLGGAVGDYPGAGMKRGTIVALAAGEPPRLLPSFRPGYRARSVAIDLVLREAERLGLVLPEGSLRATYDWHHGDLLTGGRGELLTLAPRPAAG